MLEPSLRRAYVRRAQRHRANLPALPEVMQKVVDDVEAEGVHVGSLQAFGIPGSNEMLQAASALMPKLANSSATRPGGFMVQADSAYFEDHPALYLWGIDHAVLDLVENYLGVPAAFDGAFINRSIANGLAQGTRMWHLDQHDHRMVRIIIYLNDVGDDNAAFQYIPRKESAELRRSLAYSDELMSDDIMRSVIAESRWKTCIGQRGTVIVVDPANVFHRGKVPTVNERYAVFYSYHSDRPMHERYLTPGYIPEAAAGTRDGLTERQRACVFWRA